MMTRERVVLVDAVMASVWMQRTYHVTIKPATIRQWAVRRHITSYCGSQRRYNLREVEKHARARGLIAE